MIFNIKFPTSLGLMVAEKIHWSQTRTVKWTDNPKTWCKSRDHNISK